MGYKQKGFHKHSTKHELKLNKKMDKTSKSDGRAGSSAFQKHGGPHGGIKQGFKDYWATLTGGKTSREKTKSAEREQELRDFKKKNPKQFEESSRLYPDMVYDPDAKKD